MEGAVGSVSFFVAKKLPLDGRLMTFPVENAGEGVAETLAGAFRTLNKRASTEI